MMGLPDTESTHSAILSYSASLLGLILTTLVALEFIQVALRYIFNLGIYWANDVTLLLLLSLGWLGAAHLWFINQHLTLGILDNWFEPYRTAIGLLTDILAILGALYLFPKTIETLKIYSKIELSALPVSAAITYLPILLGIGLIGISASIRTINLLSDITRARRA